MGRIAPAVLGLALGIGCAEHGVRDDDEAILAQQVAARGRRAQASGARRVAVPRVASASPDDAGPPAPVSDGTSMAAESCAAGLRPSECANQDAVRTRACLDACIAAIEVRQESAAASAESLCESRLHDGKGLPTCGLATLPHAIKKLAPDALLEIGRTLVLVDDFDTFVHGSDSVLGRALDKVGGSGTARRVRDALASATAPDSATLDAAFAQWIPLVLQLREAACAETCEERGRAAKDGAGLVHAYKMCMVSADASMEARRLQAYESTLYREFLEHADSKCRAASRCDWLEGFSALRCTYDSPG